MLKTVITVSKLVASLGSGMVVSGCVERIAPIAVRKIDKILIGIGTFAISGLVSKHVSDYVEESINEVMTEWKDADPKVVILK